MNAALEKEVPSWVWWTVGGVTLGTIAGLAVWLGRRPRYDWLLRRAGAPAELLILAAIQRYTESRGNPRAGLGRPELFPSWAEPRNAPRAAQVAESEAAMRGYDNNRAAYEESPFPRRMWIFGSGGAYGMLPSSALAPFRRTDTLRRGRVTPYDVFNPWRSTVMFLDYVHRVSRREEYRAMPAKHQTVLALKRGLAKPSLAWDYNESYERSRKSRQNAEEAAAALGIPKSALSRQVPREWPRYRGAQELLG